MSFIGPLFIISIATIQLALLADGFWSTHRLVGRF